MTTTSATGSIVSALGGGSGIDMAALASGLAEAQFAARIDRNTTRSETVERQISAASELQGAISQLVSGVSERIRSGDMASSPLIANGAVASVSRGTLAGSGTYSLEVTALARGQTLSSPALTAATAQVGSGTLTLRFGTVGTDSFIEDAAHPPVTVTVPSGATLTDLAAAINGAKSGVSAYVASGADGARLMLKGTDGAANGFVVEANETPGEEGLSAFAWTAGSDPSRFLAQAGDAAFKLDGLARTSPSNTIADAAPGLSLALTGTNPGAPTTIRFSDPASAVGSFMQDLTGALNELAKALNQQVDPQGGDLARDSGARALRRTLSELASTVILPGAAPGEPRTLADLGLATNRDGTFRLDPARLTATTRAAPAGVAALFTTGLYGVLATFDKIGRNATAISNPGSLGGSLQRYSALKRTLSVEKIDLADAQEKLRIQMVARFAGTEARVGASRSTLSFLQNQIAAWNAQKA